MSNIITSKGKESLERRLAEKVKELKTLLEEKAHAYHASGDGWHDNPGWTQIGQKEELISKEIGKIQKKLNDAKVVEINPESLDKVQIGLWVTFLQTNPKTSKSTQMRFQITIDEEADIKSKKISVNSPIGNQLIGLAVGQTTVVNLPLGEFEIKILQIEFQDD